MKRGTSPELCVSQSDGEERPSKVPRRGSLSTNPEPLQRKHDRRKLSQPPSPCSPDHFGKKSNPPEHRTTTPISLTHTSTPLEDQIYQWIPAPEAAVVEEMSEPASKRSRSRSISTDRGRARSVSSDNSESSSARDTRSYAYRAVNYVIILETKGCFMQPSPAGPMPDDIALCERLLHQPIATPQGTLFDDEYIDRFYYALRNRSEARLLVDLHPLIMPSAENQFIRGTQGLRDVIDGYNDPWLKTEPIYGPKPQPDHARGLKWSVFTESQRRKLGIRPDEKSPYTAREDMYFPYLTAEIKCGNQALELADRQNMHSMCIALRAVVSLCQAAGCTEEVHRRILGFSISHELDGFRIYGYYPEFEEDKVLFYRWPIAQPNVWSSEDRWTCYRFVQNVDREFLPIHTDRVIRILGTVPDPNEDAPGVDTGEVESQLSIIGSQERPGYRRAASSQSRGLQPGLRMMVQTLQQQLAEQKAKEEKREAEQKAREEKREAEQKAREAEQKVREEKLLAQLEEQLAREKQREAKREAEQKAREAEQKTREERLVAQLELQGRLLARLEQKDEFK
ncbi:hypothetical protein N7456_007061 [Penicillium angulare]|uniref:DUF7924 domain-containing protein n=1 Tax=Penicillium angulare TaxID=116970 RepID=A0A9W9KC93_9EURO|nr:hypothetical protein N7456_007061 [Penicillium angulare]